MKNINFKSLFQICLLSVAVSRGANAKEGLSRRKITPDCNQSLYSLSNALPTVSLPKLGLSTEEYSKVDFCFNPKNSSSELLGDFYKLKNAKIFDANNCTDPQSLTEEKRKLLLPFMVKVMQKNQLKVYSANTSELPKKYFFINTAKDKSSKLFDKAETENLDIGDLLDVLDLEASDDYIGTLTSNRDVVTDVDHSLGENKNMAMSFSGAGLAFIALEKMGIGNKLNLKYDTRKCAMNVSGALLVFMASFRDTAKINASSESYAPFNFACEFAF